MVEIRIIPRLSNTLGLLAYMKIYFPWRNGDMATFFFNEDGTEVIFRFVDKNEGPLILYISRDQRTITYVLLSRISLVEYTARFPYQ